MDAPIVQIGFSIDSTAIGVIDIGRILCGDDYHRCGNRTRSMRTTSSGLDLEAGAISWRSGASELV